MLELRRLEHGVRDTMPRSQRIETIMPFSCRMQYCNRLSAFSTLYIYLQKILSMQLGVKHREALNAILWRQDTLSNRSDQRAKLRVLPRLHMILDAVPANQHLQRVRRTFRALDLLDRPADSRAFGFVVGIDELREPQRVVLELGLVGLGARGGDAKGGELGHGGLAGGDGIGCEVDVVWVWLANS